METQILLTQCLIRSKIKIVHLVLGHANSVRSYSETAIRRRSEVALPLSYFNCRVQFLEADAGVGGAELPADALLGRVAVLRPSSDLCVDGGLRGPRGQGLPRQDTQFRFGPVEPVAVSGRKHQTYATCQAAAPRQAERPGKKRRRYGCSGCRTPTPGARLGGSADGRPRLVTWCAQSTAVRRAGALVVRHWPSSSTSRVGYRRRAIRIHSRRWRAVPVARGRRPHFRQQRFGWFVPADHGIARIVRLAVEIQYLFRRGHERRLAHR